MKDRIFTAEEVVALEGDDARAAYAALHEAHDRMASGMRGVGPPALWAPPPMEVNVFGSVVAHFDHGSARYGLRIQIDVGDERAYDDDEWAAAEARAVARALASLRLTWRLLIAPDRDKVKVPEGAEIAAMTEPGAAYIMFQPELTRAVEQ